MKPFLQSSNPFRSTNPSRLRLPHPTIAVTATAIVTFIAAACGTSPADTTPAWSTGSTGSGAELYQSNCASCHGADLGGTSKGPSHLSIVYEPNHHGDEAFRSAIANGARQHHWSFGDMPAIPGLDDEAIDDIIAYVRAEQERLGFDR